MKEFLNKRKFYFLATGIFLLVIFVFAEVPVFDLMALRRDIRIMHKEQIMYREQAHDDSLFLQRMNDDDFLEKYAREKFFMKRDGEEIYFIEEEDSLHVASEDGKRFFD